MAGVLSGFSFATAAEKHLKQRKHCIVFKKIYSCLFIPNCSRNHVITYTNTLSSIANQTASLPLAMRFSRIFSSFSQGILDHVTRLDL